LSKALFQVVIFGLAGSQSEPPPIVVDDDGNVVFVVERCRAAIERGIIEGPLR
jgi:hypothetical protein